MTQDTIITIVAGFLKLPSESVTPATPIDRTAVSSSILLHRMYAKLNAEGIAVRDYQQIKTVGDLLQRAGFSPPGAVRDLVIETPVQTRPVPVNGNANPGFSAGLDIEQVSALPRTDDFREAEFYNNNFTPAEIAHCILQPDPYASFAGIFAVKEAIVKADNTLRSHSFNEISITYSPEGKPLFQDWAISISHTGDTAAAVAIPPIGIQAPSTPLMAPVQRAEARFPVIAWLLVALSVLLSLTSLFFRH